MTAVEELVEILFRSDTHGDMTEIIQQAKMKEKQMIIDAYMQWYDGSNDNAGEQYYKSLTE